MQFCEQNKKLAEERESFASRVEFLQTELSQSQTFSRQEIEQLSNQMEMLQKDAELERLHAVENEKRKWEAKEDRLLHQLDEALKRSKRAEKPSEHVQQCEENALLQSSEESLSYSGLAVPSSGSDTRGTISQDLSSERLPALAMVSLSTLHSTAIPVLSTVISSTGSQFTSFYPETRPYPVTAILGCDSMSGTTDTMTCNSIQHGVMITQQAGFSAVTSGRLPSFSTVTSTTWSLPAMSIRESWSTVTEPSVSWRGQGLPVFSGLG